MRDQQTRQYRGIVSNDGCNAHKYFFCSSENQYVQEIYVATKKSTWFVGCIYTAPNSTAVVVIVAAATATAAAAATAATATAAVTAAAADDGVRGG